jgi:hypothetical protein
MKPRIRSVACMFAGWLVVATPAGCGGSGGGNGPPPPPPPPATLSIAVTTLANGVLNAPYNQTIRVTGGTGARTFEVSDGALPAGLTLDESTGVVSGIPGDPAGVSDFVIIVSDSGEPQQTDSEEFSISIGATAIGRNDTIETATPIGNGSIDASISPSGDPSAIIDADEDYYEITTTTASTISVDIDAQGTGSPLDSVIEIVDDDGVRLNSCVSPTFTSECVNDDEELGVRLDSFLEVQVAGARKIYVHVVDWGSNARPDKTYHLIVGGVN